MSESAQKTLLLLAAFVNGLSHRIRTPLSVISNDLTYFKALIPERECRRSLSRCKEIADTLKAVSLPLQGGFKLKYCSTKYFLTELRSQKGFSNIKLVNSTGRLLLDLSSIKKGFRLLLELISQFDSNGSEEADGRDAPMYLAASAGSLRVTLAFSQSNGVDNQTNDVSSPSLTEFICQGHDHDYYLAPLIDAIFIANGCQLVVSGHDPVCVSVELPLHSD